MAKKFDKSKKGVPSNRQLKVGEEIRHALSEVFMRGDFHSVEFSAIKASVTVPEVRISPDLRDATAYIMPLGGKNSAAIIKILNASAGFFRHVVTTKVNLKFSPRIIFRLDKSFDEADRIEKLLKNPKVAKDLSSSEKNA